MSISFETVFDIQKYFPCYKDSSKLWSAFQFFYCCYLAIQPPHRIETLVTRILALKKSDPAADTSALESEIDQLVYGLYGLTEEEVALIEGAG
ncbi:MAG: hypothetical protein ACKVT2_03630 [Saprospiraceae bacterium]